MDGVIVLSSTQSFIKQLRVLNDKLEGNLRVMDKLDKKSIAYKELYRENEDIINEGLRLINS